MISFKRKTACLCCFSLLLALPLSASALNLYTEEYPPFNMSDAKTGALSGISVDKVVMLMQRANQAYSIKSMPWTRSYQMALQQEHSCVFSTTRTPEREAQFQWVGPLVHNNWVVFARADDSRVPKQLEDLRPYVVGGYQNDAVAEFLKHNGFEVDLAMNDADNPRKLLHKRFDFWATGEMLGTWLIQRSHLQGQIVPLFTFKQTDMYLACHLKMPAQKITYFNQILRQMERDGSTQAIERKYR